MNKFLFALALPALFSASALAQTNVTVYGVVDAGLVRESGAPTGPVTNLSSGIASGSRLGFKGREDLGGGMAAVFLLENGFNADTGAAGQSGLLFGRQAFVGLTGRLGALTLGRQYSPYYKTLRDVGDPFGAVSLAGRAGNLLATNTRTDNMVEYVSPAFGGVRADLAYGAGETAGDSARNRSLSGSLGYTGGPLGVQLAYHRIDNATATDATSNALLAANYNAGWITAYLSYAVNKGPGTARGDDMVAGVALPVRTGKLLLSHVRHDDRAAVNRDATQWGIAYLLPLSKRTDVYAAYAAIDNRNGAAYKVGNATDRGTGDRAFNLGVRHNF
ncbi:porin [Pseudoduganella namucuonensis]|uniref:Outer membrane protein (Porin) n=1 Tax=Pseudoduganella namucuonensis TaxID=1035707 RepID=A0A1I7LZT6_9BURK|nr:porin [Pseudoduganella namucuonensis]SFV15198.1 Outer membrane protein (porin) [Pseudoduganella namucuonensis]